MFGIVICIFYFYFLFFYGEKSVLTKKGKKKEKKKGKKILHYGIMHMLILKIFTQADLVWDFFFSLHILSWLGLFLASRR